MKFNAFSHMFCVKMIFLLVLFCGHSSVRAQGQPGAVYYTPYGPSSQYGQQPNAQPYGVGAQYGSQLFGGDPYQQMANGQNPFQAQVPCQRSLDEELNAKAGIPVDAQQPKTAPDAPCDKPGSEHMPLEVLCSLPPDKGLGNDDVFRYYYNPVVQQCIPFSYSGKSGNANRFVSVKNCYEICHPADPTVKKPRVVSGIKAYLVPNLKSDCEKSDSHQQFDRQKVRTRPKEVVIRQIPHPLDPTKTLTIIQNAQYVSPQEATNGQLPNGPQDPNDPNNVDPNLRRLYQYETVPQFVPNPYGR